MQKMAIWATWIQSSVSSPPLNAVNNDFCSPGPGRRVHCPEYLHPNTIAHDNFIFTAQFQVLPRRAENFPDSVESDLNT